MIILKWSRTLNFIFFKILIERFNRKINSNNKIIHRDLGSKRVYLVVNKTMITINP